jgi:hypothetical protein
VKAGSPSRAAVAATRAFCGAAVTGEMSPTFTTARARFSRASAEAVVSQGVPAGQPPTFGGANGTWPRPVSPPASEPAGTFDAGTFNARSAPVSHSTGSRTSTDPGSRNAGDRTAARTRAVTSCPEP